MELLKALRDPVWGSLAVLVALVALYFAYLAIRPTVELAMGTVFRRRLVAISPTLAKAISSQFPDTSLARIELITYAIKNSGTSTIRATDFERPITVTFGDSARVLSAEISSTNPHDLEVHLSRTDTSIEVPSMLLNMGDWILVDALVSEPTEQIVPSARIAGVTKIAPVDYRTGGATSSDGMIVSVLTAVVVGNGLAIAIQIEEVMLARGDVKAVAEQGGIFAAISCVLVVVFATFYKKFSKRARRTISM